MTLNGVIAPYFALFHGILVYDVVVKQLLGLLRFQNLRSVQLFSDYLGKTNW